MVYGWLPGIDAWQAQAMGFLSEDEARELNERAIDGDARQGLQRPGHEAGAPHRAAGGAPNGSSWGNGEIRYGLVDFELLERTAEYWQELKAARLEDLQQPEARVAPGDGDGRSRQLVSSPRTSAPSSILGVDYIHGRVESTGGMLWVVGRDPELFDYFLPERWRTTPQIRFLEIHETYFTTSKDNIPLVWKVSRVGERPEVAAFGADGFRVLAYGFNSPFEEVAAAWWLRRRGIPTILPRAIYRTGHRSQLDESLFDPSRYQTHAAFPALDGEPVLEARRNYITIWDYWNGREPMHERGRCACWEIGQRRPGRRTGIAGPSGVFEFGGGFQREAFEGRSRSISAGACAYCSFHRGGSIAGARRER